MNRSSVLAVMLAMVLAGIFTAGNSEAQQPTARDNKAVLLTNGPVVVQVEACENKERGEEIRGEILGALFCAGWNEVASGVPDPAIVITVINTHYSVPGDSGDYNGVDLRCIPWVRDEEGRKVQASAGFCSDYMSREEFVKKVVEAVENYSELAQGKPGKVLGR